MPRPFSGSDTLGRQRGAVLVVGLVMLAVTTLLVVSMVKTSVVELKIGGASQIAQQNLTNAELQIARFIDQNNGRFAANFLTLGAGAGGPVTAASATYSATTGLLAAQPSAVYGGNANLVVRQIQCAPARQVGTQIGGTFDFAYFDVGSTATGTLGGSTTVHQGVRTIVPAGTCT